MNWYKFSKQKIIVLPKVKERMESIGWLDPLIEKLKSIKPVSQSGIYRISLDESYGGRDFNLKIEVSPVEIQIVDVVPIDPMSPIRQLG